MKSIKIEKPEWVFVSKITFLVLVLTSLPYLYGYLSAPYGKTFMGIMLDVPDHVQYFSWMRELTTSNIVSNKLTSEANDPIFFNLLWWLMARVSKPFGIGFSGAIQLLRFTATIIFFVLAYRLCARVFEDQLRRQTAFLITVFTSGFGWLLVLLKYTVLDGSLIFPLDLYVAEGNTFLCILGYPHFIAAASYIYIFDLVLRGQEKGQLRYGVLAGLLALFLGWQHTYDLISIYGVLFAYAGVCWLRDRKFPTYLFWSGLMIGSISGWPALYSVILTSKEPLWREVLAQFANAGVFTPSLFHLPILLGSAFIAAILKVINDNPLRLKGVRDVDLFIRVWFLFTFILIYLPVDYQIHLLNGWQVPIAILAAWWLFDTGVPWLGRLFEKFGRTWTKEQVRKIAVIAFILLIIPTNLYLFLWRFTELSRHTYPYYLYDDEIAAMSWIEENADSDDVVLSSLTTGQYIPAWTGTHAFIAHWAFTVDYYTKTDIVSTFFSEETDDHYRQDILRTHNVDYVLVGPAEKDLGSADFHSVPFMDEVFKTPLVEVYKVNANAQNKP